MVSSLLHISYYMWPATQFSEAKYTVFIQHTFTFAMRFNSSCVCTCWRKSNFLYSYYNNYYIGHMIACIEVGKYKPTM